LVEDSGRLLLRTEKLRSKRLIMAARVLSGGCRIGGFSHHKQSGGREEGDEKPARNGRVRPVAQARRSLPCLGCEPAAGRNGRNLYCAGPGHRQVRDHSRVAAILRIVARAEVVKEDDSLTQDRDNYGYEHGYFSLSVHLPVSPNCSFHAINVAADRRGVRSRAPSTAPANPSNHLVDLRFFAVDGRIGAKQRPALGAMADAR
jgi:hypothetical protein